MIRKPPADWDQVNDGTAVRTIRTTSALARDAAGLAQRGGHIMRGLLCYFFALLWGFAAIASGLGGSLPSLIGIGGLAAFMFWVGNRAFAKAHKASAC